MTRYCYSILMYVNLNQLKIDNENENIQQRTSIWNCNQWKLEFINHIQIKVGKMVSY